MKHETPGPPFAQGSVPTVLVTGLETARTYGVNLPLAAEKRLI